MAAALPRAGVRTIPAGPAPSTLAAPVPVAPTLPMEPPPEPPPEPQQPEAAGPAPPPPDTGSVDRELEDLLSGSGRGTPPR